VQTARQYEKAFLVINPSPPEEHTMPHITRLGHVGLFCNDLMKMRDFYSRVMGLAITDEDLERGICFLSADPEAEHHELALAQAKDPSQKNAQCPTGVL
jgi:catechol-2,3-dioxygenase